MHAVGEGTVTREYSPNMSEPDAIVVSLQQQIGSAVISGTDQMTVELPVPPEAIGRIIGTEQVHITMLRQIPNIGKVQLVRKAPNVPVLLIVGQIDAVTQVVNISKAAICRASRKQIRDVHPISPTGIESSRQQIGSEVTSDKDDKVASNQTTVELPVPSEAIGRIVGTQQVHITMLRQIPNIIKVELVRKTPNAHVLLIVGRIDAVTQVVNTAQNVICRAQTALSNQSRAVHSWHPTSSGQVLTSREVHKTGDRAPPKDSKKYEREQMRIKEAAKRFERGEPEHVPPSHAKESRKEIKERNNEFELAREQFEKVNAARAAAAAASKCVRPNT